MSNKTSRRRVGRSAHESEGCLLPDTGSGAACASFWTEGADGQAGGVGDGAPSGMGGMSADGCFEAFVSRSWQGGNFQMPDGKTKLPNDPFKLPNGRIKLPDDPFKMPNGRIKLPDDNFKLPNGKIRLPDGNFEWPDDKIRLPNGNLVWPNGKTRLSDDKTDLPEGSASRSPAKSERPFTLFP